MLIHQIFVLHAIIIHLEIMKGKKPIFLIHCIANAKESNANIGKI
jgi:hypothetical protein